MTAKWCHVKIKTYCRTLNHDPATRLRTHGLTIVEVLISMVLVTMIVAGLYTCTEQALRGGSINAMHVAAYGLLQDKFEQMRGGVFSDISVANYPTQAVVITTSGGMNGTNTITGTFSCTVTNLAAPARKMVQLTLSWNYRGFTNISETLAGSIVDPNAAASLMGSLTGYLYMNPSGGAPAQFTLTQLGGGTLTWANITNLSQVGSTVFTASDLVIQVGGSGTQTTIQYNYQPFPMSNAKQWTIDDTSGFRTRFIYCPSNSPPCWRMRVSGQNAVISTQ